MRKRILVDTSTNSKIVVRPSMDRQMYEMRKALGKTKEEVSESSTEYHSKRLQQAWRAHEAASLNS